MRGSSIAAIALVAAAAPAVALPLDELAILARAMQYRRSMDEVDSILARSSKAYRSEPWNHLRPTIGVAVRPSSRSPEPFVIPSFAEDKTYIPACHTGHAFCLRSILDELD